MREEVSKQTGQQQAARRPIEEDYLTFARAQKFLPDGAEGPVRLQQHVLEFKTRVLDRTQFRQVRHNLDFFSLHDSFFDRVLSRRLDYGTGVRNVSTETRERICRPGRLWTAKAVAKASKNQT